MRILLMPNFTKPRTWELLGELCRRMGALGLQAAAVRKDREAMEALGIGPVAGDWESPEEAAPFCDLLLSIGGDGTVIHSACCAAQAGKPVVGVNI